MRKARRTPALGNMKRTSNLWEKITDLENIKQAHLKARKGKAFYKEVQEFDSDTDKYCKMIQEMLLNKTFTTSPYGVSEIFDGRKQRVIHKLPYFPDRVVHHALMQVLSPIIYKGLIRDTFQSIPERGTSDAAKRVKRLVREKKPKYALKLDINKYYPSVNNSLLKHKLRNKIKCKDTLWLLDDIIDSNQGLPIGNYTSQILGNFYLSELDWKIKQQIKPLGYFRYCDDLVLLSNSKTFLRDSAKLIEFELTRHKLEVKANLQILDIQKQGLDFVGYCFKHSTTRLRKSIALGFINASQSKPSLSQVMAYKGWVKYSNSKMLWRKYTKHLNSKFKKQLSKKV